LRVTSFCSVIDVCTTFFVRASDAQSGFARILFIQITNDLINHATKWLQVRNCTAPFAGEE
jgi:hypothetical protein